MPIIVTCNCGQRLQAPDTLAGKTTKCPKCSSPLAIPAPAAPAGGLQPLSDPSDPLGLGDLGQYESNMGHGQPMGNGQPMGYGQPMGGAPMPGYDPMMGGGAPMPAGAYGWQQPAGHGWPQQPGAASGAKLSMGLLVAIVGGAVGLVVLGAIAVVAVLLFTNSDGDTTIAQGDSSNQSPSTTTYTPAEPKQDTTSIEETPIEPDLAETTDDPDGNGDGADSTASPTVETTKPEPPKPDPPKLTPTIEKWRGQASNGLRGAIPIKGEDMVILHHSWQTELLPYLGYQDLYQKFDMQKSWSKSPNLKLTQTVIPQFLNPADDRIKWKGYPFNGTAMTHFVGMSGLEDTRNAVAAALPRSDPRAGVFGYDRIARPDEITDGLSNTIMILGSGELAGPWAAGGGATIRGAREPYFDPLTGFNSRGMSMRGAYAVFADGSVREISADISPEIFRAMCTIHGAETVDKSHLGQTLAHLPVKRLTKEEMQAPEEEKEPESEQAAKTSRGRSRN